MPFSSEGNQDCRIEMAAFSLHCVVKELNPLIRIELVAAIRGKQGPLGPTER